MSTLLQEILTEQEVLKMPPGDPSLHKKNCSCLQCSHGIDSPAHKNWRQRRNARYFVPADNCKGAQQNVKGGQPPVPAPGSPASGIDSRKRSALLQHWTQKMKQAQSPVEKAQYRKYIITISKRLRPV